MGYTHYFTFLDCHGNTATVERAYQNAIKDCNKIIAAYYNKNKGTELSLSGYSAHSNNYGGINLNGKGELGHEAFNLREHFKQNLGFNFCKTARKPYDIVVTACLVVLKYHLANFIEVSSDGQNIDWIQGLNLAYESTDNIRLFNPIYKDITELNK